MLQHLDVRRPVGAGGANRSAERADRLRRKSTPANAGERGHARVIPPAHMLLLHQLQQFALAQQRVRQVQPVELNLLRWENSQLLDIPAIQRLVIRELQRAHRVRYVLNRVRLPVRVVVHRIDAPLVTRAVVRRMQNAIHHRIAHVQVWRSHVDLGTQHTAAVRKLPVLHPHKQV